MSSETFVDLAYQYGRACERWGYAQAACFTPFPSPAATRALEDAEQEVRSTMEAIQKRVQDDLDHQLAEARKGTAEVFKAIVGGALVIPAEAHDRPSPPTPKTGSPWCVCGHPLTRHLVRGSGPCTHGGCPCIEACQRHD